MSEQQSPPGDATEVDLSAATMALQSAWHTLGVDPVTVRLGGASTPASETLIPTQDLPKSRDEAALGALRPWSIEAPGVASSPGAGPVDLRLGSTIGEGGMGVVICAEQVALGRDVAVKTLRVDDERAEAVLALLREAWVTGSLEHPGIVPVHGLGRSPRGAPLFVMKRIDGQPWSSFIHQPALLPADGQSDSLRWHLEVLMQVCNTIAFAHSRRVLHRDLKPDNVMIGPFGEVYVLDWGLAVALPGGDARLPQVASIHTIAGTPHFMSPEMIEARPDAIDERSDVFLLGAILHMFLTGQPRHRGRTPLEVLAAGWRCEPIVYPSYVPEELAAIANRATARAPGDRFASVSDLRVAIASYLSHRHSLDLTRAARQHLRTLRRLLSARLQQLRAADADADTIGDALPRDDASALDLDTMPSESLHDDGGAPRAPGSIAGSHGAEPSASATGDRSNSSEASADGSELPADDEAMQAAISSAFSSARFGFHVALQSWPENESAKAGQAQTLDLMIDFRLHTGDLAIVRLLATERGAVDADTAARIEALAEQHRAAAEAAMANEGAVIDRDVRYGARTRTIFAAIMAVMFGGQALAFAVLQQIGLYHWDYVGTWTVATLFLALVLGFGHWARVTLNSTAFNRSVLRSLQLTAIVNLALIGGSQALGLTATTALTFEMLLFANVNAMYGAMLDVRLWASALPYLLAFCAAIVWPSAILAWVGAAHLLAIGLIGWLWRPRLVDGRDPGDARVLAQRRALADAAVRPR